MKEEKKNSRQVVAQNRKARHDFTIEEVFEAGIVLTGSEVKSLRSGKASLVDAYAVDDGRELILINAHIPEYDKTTEQNYEAKKPRKLLLHRREINKLIGKIRTKGYTMVALSIYFNAKGRAKVELAIAKGKTKYDKRESEKKREWQREKKKLL